MILWNFRNILTFNEHVCLMTAPNYHIFILLFF